jgi:hypothetical protein
MRFDMDTMGTSSVGAGMGLGGLAVGGIGGLILGALVNGSGGLFGGNNRGVSAEAVGLGALEFMEQANLTNMNICNAKVEALNSASTNRATIIESAGATQTALAAGNFTTLSSINGLGRDVISGQNQIQLETLNSFNTLNTTALQGFNSIQANAFRDASAIQATLQQQNMVQAQCCCEIKQAISTDGQATRALINDIRLAELQSELADTKNSLSNANQTLVFDGKLNAMATTIITHLAPSHGVVRTA